MAPSARTLFLSSFSAIYLCAFTSYLLQFDGLYSSKGLLPAHTHHQRIAAQHKGASLQRKFEAHPSLLWLLGPKEDMDVALEALTLLGILLSALGVAGMHHGLLFLTLFVSYLTLFAGGQTFLSFQWDLFLLETGAATVLYAPWWSFTVAADEALGVAHPMTWPMRLQWVKFMIMSGTVKVRVRHALTTCPLAPCIHAPYAGMLRGGSRHVYTDGSAPPR